MPAHRAGHPLQARRFRPPAREAQERQGDAFDIRQFHNAVLDSGSLPLAVLDTVVQIRLP